ncbi:unnamed protein product [Chrysodeixis includens]|uniref:Uncharacterized protein n=1 Tax=Chrysodeixis includens TaxID=689277 RepID=A0A9N8Q1I7_CHRIL|nr:unnamed protein product [Chrysodeixis includens]
MQRDARQPTSVRLATPPPRQLMIKDSGGILKWHDAMSIDTLKEFSSKFKGLVDELSVYFEPCGFPIELVARRQRVSQSQARAKPKPGQSQARSRPKKLFDLKLVDIIL